MRIVLHSRRRRRDGRGRRRVGWVACALSATGCVFELEELREPDPTENGVPPFDAEGPGGGDAPPVAGGGAGVDDPAGSADEDAPCPFGEKSCDGTCVVQSPENGCGNESCSPCAAVPQAVLGCTSDFPARCKVEHCALGFADCDGDAVGGVGELAGNGCEYSFGTLGSPSDPLVVPNVQIDVGDGSRDDWNGVVAHEMQRTCVDCSEDNVLPPLVAQNTVPPESDLTAYFRVAWDRDFFYVLGEAFDNRVFSAGSSIDDGRCNNNEGQPGPACEDAFALFFDGLDNRESFNQNDDRWVFFGTSGRFFAPAQGQPPASAVDMQVLPSPGELCYRVEAKLAWSYLVGNAQQPIEGHFPPAEGQTYGFDVAVNDWDESVSTPGLIERQSQLFHYPKPAELNYRARADGLGGIRLIGAPEGADPGALQ